MYLSRALSVLGLWLTVALPMHAQQRGPQDPSHDLLPGVIDRNAAEKRLGERFHLSAEKTPLGLLERLLRNPERYGVDPKQIEDIARDIARRPKDFGINLN